MLNALSTLVAGGIFGLAIAAPPGPMNAIIAEESVLRGWLAGVRAGLGAFTADVVFFLLALYGAVTFVETYPTVRGVMVGAGGLLMCYFAYGAAKNATQNFTGDGHDDEQNGFKKAFVLALTNPYQIVFWLTIGVGLLQPGTIDVFAPLPYIGQQLGGSLVVETGSTLLLAGFFGGILFWVGGFPATLVAAERRMDAVAPVVAYLSAGILALFGVLFLSDAVATLL
ncbi:LysE family transporter [Haladaptatus sp. DJG-WS-42]|uniref:LysE family translocator n=1 Tax=Haladaptatus sp. DJG-WS-42 TaxID=3120516 RepID=UPI0030CF402B